MGCPRETGPNDIAPGKEVSGPDKKTSDLLPWITYLSPTPNEYTMYTLTYESKAVSNLSDAHVEDILKTARSFNAQNGITGCLIFYLSGFIQILEGPKEEVTQLYRRIEKDKRHTKVKMFSEDEITERNFPDWGMAYYPISENSLGHAEFLQFKRNLLLLADLSKPTNVTTILFWKRMKFLISTPPKKVK